ncbi:type VI secretion system-associated protein TagF [Azoarcus communis]|uniref:Type VI secretion system-associated protein TagF n=2 Tax=Parazoarcus communis TaxID=41977 RepID=A0A323URT2_9RHOO|nr:type VI secretion system-associated protein TagF [Azoarcus communis] [Parazoarcus communis SWub3 = DSM 12120]
MRMRLPFKRLAQPPLLGWFGKLPAVGDFAGRGLPLSLREGVHAWCADGMVRLAERHGEMWREAYQLSPIWHFAMNAGVWDERPLLGCVAPSMDRVGRCSPLVVLRSIESDHVGACLPPQSDWSYKTDALVRRIISDTVGVEAVQIELEATLGERMPWCSEATTTGEILADLGIGEKGCADWFSWPDLCERFAERRRRSFWWAEPSPMLPPKQVIHNGEPDADLFELLLMGWADR